MLVKEATGMFNSNSDDTEWQSTTFNEQDFLPSSLHANFIEHTKRILHIACAVYLSVEENTEASNFI